MIDHLFINEKTGVSVLFGRLPAPRPLLDVFAVCDCCGGDVIREDRQTDVGILTRLICPCSCRVSIDLFTDVKSVSLFSFLDVVGVNYD
jgi:hypothetical protein